MSSETGLSLIMFLLASAAAALPGIVLRPGEWYRALAKPSWRPPNWLFGPVWAVLYIMIAVAGWRVWLAAEPAQIGPATTAFGLQLVLNACWSAIFFGLHRPDWAFIEMVALWLAILATAALFAPIDALAAALMLPYLAWVSFALALNYRVWRLNPERSSW